MQTRTGPEPDVSKASSIALERVIAAAQQGAGAGSEAKWLRGSLKGSRQVLGVSCLMESAHCSFSRKKLGCFC